jgi:hypothetical protein
MLKDNLKVDDIRINPSAIVQMTEDEIGEALRRIREQAKRVKTRKELNQLQELRVQFNNRLDQFIDLHMDALDNHPDVGKIVKDLTTLTLGVTVAVKEMRTFKSAIQKGTKILGYADRILQLLENIPGVL